MWRFQVVLNWSFCFCLLPCSTVMTRLIKNATLRERSFKGLLGVALIHSIGCVSGFYDTAKERWKNKSYVYDGTMIGSRLVLCTLYIWHINMCVTVRNNVTHNVDHHVYIHVVRAPDIHYPGRSKDQRPKHAIIVWNSIDISTSTRWRTRSTVHTYHTHTTHVI